MKPQTSLILSDGLITVTPSYPIELHKQLTFWHRSMVQEGYKRIVSGEYKQLYTSETVIQSDGTLAQQLTTLPGFASRVFNFLVQQGYDVLFADKRTPMPKPNVEAALVGLRDYQIEPIHNIILAGGGVVHAPCGWGKGRCIAGIIKAFDHNELVLRGTPQILAIAPEIDLCRKNYAELKTLLGKSREVGLIMTGSKVHSDDVQVITFDSLNHINMAEVGIIIVDEMHTAGSEARVDSLLSATRAARWGVSATPFGRFDGGDLTTEGVFGPVVFRSTYQEGIASGALVPIVVCWVPCPPPACGMDKYANYKKRDSKMLHGIENNVELNKIIAALLTTIPNELQTLCIVPHVNHINNILEFAPDVPYVHAQTSEDKLKADRYYNVHAVSKKERTEMYEKMETGTVRKAMSTYVYKQGVNFPGLTVMICPGGGGSEIIAGQMPGRASRAGVDGKDCAYIVEFSHEWDIQTKDGKKQAGPLLRDDRSRRRVYTELGFAQVSVTNINELPFLSKEINAN